MLTPLDLFDTIFDFVSDYFDYWPWLALALVVIGGVLLWR